MIMNLLLDTHTYIWSVISPRILSKKAKSEIHNQDNVCWVSVLSLWEISIKFALKKLYLKGVAPEDLPNYIDRAGFKVLNITAETVSTFYKLPRLNKDPFDRMLAWQAIRENYILLSKDKGFDDYRSLGLNRIW